MSVATVMSVMMAVLVMAVFAAFVSLMAVVGVMLAMVAFGRRPTGMHGVAMMPTHAMMVMPMMPVAAVP